MSQRLWYNGHIQVNTSPTHFIKFSEKNINYISQLLTINRSVKFWQTLRHECDMHNHSYCQWSQITQPAITCSKLTIETLEQGVKYVQS